MEENDQDQLMEDLFGDASDHVNVSITPSPPPAKGLPQRLDQLAASNCCQCVLLSGNLVSLSPHSNCQQGKLLGRDLAV